MPDEKKFDRDGIKNTLVVAIGVSLVCSVLVSAAAIVLRPQQEANQKQFQQQIVLPDCEELPPIGTRESEDCVKIDIPFVSQLIQPDTCIKGDGSEYRGTVSTTRSGLTCVPWAYQNDIQTVKHLELIGNIDEIL